jgi:hypothetical protein
VHDGLRRLVAREAFAICMWTMDKEDASPSIINFVAIYLDGMRQLYRFRSVVRWLLAIVAATFVAAIPSKLSSHDLAVGFPLTWQTRQEIITSGEQPHSFNLWLLLFDVALVLAVFVVLRIAVSKFIHRRRTDESQPSHTV